VSFLSKLKSLCTSTYTHVLMYTATNSLFLCVMFISGFNCTKQLRAFAKIELSVSDHRV